MRTQRCELRDQPKLWSPIREEHPRFKTRPTACPHSSITQQSPQMYAATNHGLTSLVNFRRANQSGVGHSIASRWPVQLQKITPATLKKFVH